MLFPPISIVVPAYNEEKNISSALNAIYSFLGARECVFEVIVVDDGSADGTVLCVRELQQMYPRLMLICCGANRGKGYAVRKGMKLARHDIIFFIDADGSTPIKELPKFLDAHAHGADIAIGSRYIRDSTITVKQPLYRVFLGRCGNLLIQLLLLPGIRDTQCGFKSFTRTATQRLTQLQTINRWGFDMELLVLGRLFNYRIVEIPVTWQDATNRQSRFRPLKDAHRTLTELFRIKHNLRTGIYREGQ